MALQPLKWLISVGYFNATMIQRISLFRFTGIHPHSSILNDSMITCSSFNHWSPIVLDITGTPGVSTPSISLDDIDIFTGASFFSFFLWTSSSILGHPSVKSTHQSNYRGKRTMGNVLVTQSREAESPQKHSNSTHIVEYMLDFTWHGSVLLKPILEPLNIFV